jgi:hypothetical protein
MFPVTFQVSILHPLTEFLQIHDLDSFPHLKTQR